MKRMAKSPLVYVVDDDPSVRRAVGRLIRSEGFAVKGFASAQEFLNETHLGLSEPGKAIRRPGPAGCHSQGTGSKR